jgi:hypothetical protein
MSDTDSPSTASEWVLEEVDHRVAPTPDGKQNVSSDVWTATSRLRDDGRKYSVDFDTDEIEAAIAALDEDGELVSWHGLLAPATDEHLQAIIQNEAQAGVKRSTLVGKCNRLLQNSSTTE